jgi:4-alpha-glucanotransferase
VTGEETVTSAIGPARGAGVLLHPTSLPGLYGIGDLGPIAYEWVDVLAAAKQSWWQILPLGPTGFGDSPYQCFSAFAGNPYLLSPELLARDGLLEPVDYTHHGFPDDHVEYGPVIQFKQHVLTRAWENFQARGGAELRKELAAFCGESAWWLDDFALFMALKDAHGGGSWQTWPEPLLMREPEALREARRTYGAGVARHKLGQFLFFRQWRALKAHANGKGVRLIGDAPIFVATDSADVWANPGLFQLDEHRRPAVVAGVPPDYFSATGQLWGNPHYNWEAMRADGYAWWIARMRATLAQVDLVRLDHFRGFEAHWEIPAGSLTAQTGHWVKGPGADLLTALELALGGLPLIAEDLGVITPEVDALRRRFGLPGMRILQFAFSGPDNRFLPHHYEPNTVVYSGTHDNDTTVGWFAEMPGYEREFLRRYAPWAGHEIAWDLIRMAWSSVAQLAVAPLQDLLSLPTSGRMNFPGKPANNWRWRFVKGQVHEGVMGRLADLTWLCSRDPGAVPPRAVSG